MHRVMAAVFFSELEPLPNGATLIVTVNVAVFALRCSTSSCASSSGARGAAVQVLAPAPLQDLPRMVPRHQGRLGADPRGRFEPRDFPRDERSRAVRPAAHEDAPQLARRRHLVRRRQRLPPPRRVGAGLTAQGTDQARVWRGRSRHRGRRPPPQVGLAPLRPRRRRRRRRREQRPPRRPSACRRPARARRAAGR